MTTSLGDGWHMATRTERVGWFRCKGDDSRLDFDPTVDAVIRVFYFQYLGTIAVAEVSNQTRAKFAQGTDLDTAVSALAKVMAEEFTANSEAMFNFSGKVWKKYASTDVKAEFTPSSRVAYQQAKLQHAGDTSLCGFDLERARNRTSERLQRHMPDMVLTNAKLMPKAAQEKQKFGSLSGAFSGLDLAVLNLAPPDEK